jgi:hypothetical protein
MPPVKVFIFDIAGTIIEDHGEVLSAFSAAPRKNGIPVTLGELKRSKGASKRELTRHFVGELGCQSRANGKARDYLPLLSARNWRSSMRNALTLSRFGGNLRLVPRPRHPDGDHGGLPAWTERSDPGKDGMAGPIRGQYFQQRRASGRPAPFASNPGVRGIIGVLTGAHDRETLERRASRSHCREHRRTAGLMERGF